MKRNMQSTRNVTPHNQPPESNQRHGSPLLMQIGIPLALTIVCLGAFLSKGIVSDAYEPATFTGPASAVSSRLLRTDIKKSTRPESFQWNWPTDGNSTYQIKYTMDLAPGAAGMTQDIGGMTQIDGKLSVCFMNADAEGVSLAMQMSEVVVTRDPGGHKTAARQPVIETMLNSSPGLVRFDRDGRVLSCKLPAALADEDRIMLQSIFAPEFVLGNGESWEQDEKLNSMACRSSYRVTNGSKIAKSRRALEAPQGQPSLRIIKSGFIAVPGPFWIESLDGSEKLQYVWENRTICEVDTSIKMARLNNSITPASLATLLVDPAKQDELLDSLSLASTDESVRISARERQQLAQLVEKYQAVPSARMIEDLLKAVSAGTGHEATIPAMHALRDWLLANPARAGEIAEALKNPALKGPMAARMMHALELAGQSSLEAQATLASILSAPTGTYSPSVLAQAIVAAGGVGSLQNPALIAALINMSSAEDPSADYRLSDASFFALGALAKDNPSLQQNLVDALSSRLTTDGKVPAMDTSTALLSFANAHSQDAGVIESGIAILKNHPDPEVRANAVLYLLTTGTPEAFAAVRHAQEHDESEPVKRVVAAHQDSLGLAQSTSPVR